ncbi:MAG: hypothetical protein ACJ8AD_19780, partial [Gemmatimonadaceae bacterium]
MDARESLRRYLEQRRDLGETELVLDSLSVEEALRLLGAAKGGARPAASSREEPSAARPSAAEGAESTDWRAAVRAAGGAPEARTPVRPPRSEEQHEMPRPAAPPPQPPPAADAVHVPSTQKGAPAGSPLEDVPTGLSVGGASRALFEDPAFKLASLEEINATVATCRRCSLYATATNPVPGVGDPNADFMCVGEAPG